MFTRRNLLVGAAAAPLFGQVRMTARERIDRVLAGADVDRVPFSYWHHFGLEKEPPDQFARATLDFHRKFRTDLVKVMSDYPYPSDAGRVYENPFPAQIRALEIIRDSLGGSAHFVETIFNPWNVAEKLTSKEHVAAMRTAQPQQLLDMLERIAQSEANHARLAVNRGASGVFLAIANAQTGILTPDEYRKFSEPYDRMVIDAVASAPLNILHLHGDKVYINHFIARSWPAALNYSDRGTGFTIADLRAKFGRLILGGLDEVNYRKLTVGDLLKQAKQARAAAGRKFILTPGCSVPNESTDEELLRLPRALRIPEA